MFRCGCDFGGVDMALTADQGLDCDCSVAKCTCQKKCSCTGPGAVKTEFIQQTTTSYPIKPSTSSPPTEATPAPADTKPPTEPTVEGELKIEDDDSYVEVEEQTAPTRTRRKSDDNQLLP
jgi:type IV secretory pathway VirB10-like protein